MKYYISCTATYKAAIGVDAKDENEAKEKVQNLIDKLCENDIPTYMGDDHFELDGVTVDNVEED